MTEDQRFIAIGAYINSALYCAGVFVAGIVRGNPWAWRLALATVGVTFLCYNAQLALPQIGRGTLSFMTWCTIVVGICAGVSLL